VGKIDPVVSGGEGFVEALLGLFQPVPRLLVQRVAGLESLVDLLDGVKLPQPVLDRIGEMAVLAGEDQQVVLLLLVIEEVLQFAGRHLAVGLDDDQHPGAAELQLIQLGQHLHVLVGVAALGLEDAGQAVDEGLVDLGLGYLPGVALDLAGQVFRFLDEEALLLAMEIPRAPLGIAENLQSLDELIGLSIGRGQVFDDLAVRETDAAPDGPRQGGSQQERHDLLRGIAAQFVIDDFRDGVAAAGDVASHRRYQRVGDALDLVPDLVVVEVQMLRADQENIVRLPLRDALEQPGGELHQAAGLPKAFVFLEQRHQVLEGRMKGIGLPHLFGDPFQAGGDDVAAVLGPFDLLGVLLGDFGDDPLIGQLVDQPFLEDFVDFVARQLHRCDGHGLAAGLLLEIGNRLGQRAGLGRIAARQVGDDDAAVG
jgi:hypothetical protein